MSIGMYALELNSRSELETSVLERASLVYVYIY